MLWYSICSWEDYVFITIRKMTLIMIFHLYPKNEIKFVRRIVKFINTKKTRWISSFAKSSAVLFSWRFITAISFPGIWSELKNICRYVDIGHVLILLTNRVSQQGFFQSVFFLKRASQQNILFHKSILRLCFFIVKGHLFRKQNMFIITIL